MHFRGWGGGDTWKLGRNEEYNVKSSAPSCCLHSASPTSNFNQVTMRWRNRMMVLMVSYASRRLRGLWIVTLFSATREENTWSTLWVALRKCLWNCFAKRHARLHAFLSNYSSMHHSCTYSSIRLLHGARFLNTKWKRSTKWTCRRFPSRLQRICPLPPALSPTPSSVTPMKLSAIAFFWTSKTSSQQRYYFRRHNPIQCIVQPTLHAFAFLAGKIPAGKGETERNARGD